jgi:hypothetical protein
VDRVESAEPLAPRTFGKLPTQARSSLLSFLQARPEVVLPPILESLEGTNGFYVGDGRPEREIILGFRPEFIVFTIPLFPDGPRRFEGKEFILPPLHAQPEKTDRGFMVGAAFNQKNQPAMYLAWKPAPAQA